MIIPDLPNVSLVGFYGEKPLELMSIVRELQTYLASVKIIRDNFIPYSLEQIHGTIIGCEGLKTSEGIIHKWLYETTTKIEYIDYSGFIEYLKKQNNLPIGLRFGGYRLERQYGFLSRGLHPTIRSFQLQIFGDEIIPVLIGWSWKNNLISQQIDCLRRGGKQFNLLHKYHRHPESIDNDFYLRLGTINKKISSENISLIESEVRRILSKRTPIDINLDRENLFFVRYQNSQLPLQTTIKIPLLDATPFKIELLY